MRNEERRVQEPDAFVERCTEINGHTWVGSSSIILILLVTLCCTNTFADTDGLVPVVSKYTPTGPPDPGSWLNIAAALPSPSSSIQHDPLTNAFTYGGSLPLVAVPGFSVVRCGSQTITLTRPVIYYDGSLFIAREDQPLIRSALVLKTSSALARSTTHRPTTRRWLVVLDPGHGGHDTGAIGHRIVEKSINLKVARYVKSLLEQKGFQVRFTRSDDTFVELDDRPEIANRCQADLFIAIHANAQRSGTITGVETFYCDTDKRFNAIDRGRSAARTCRLDPRKFELARDPAYDIRSIIYGLIIEDSRYQSRRLAALIQQGILKQVPADDRGTKPGALRVLRFANCPAVLVEIGFISNRQEAKRLADSSYQKRIAAGIANGIAQFAAREQQ